jgi:hypothetical protein
MEQSGPEDFPEHPQGGVACLWIVPVVEHCGMRKVGCAGSDSDASIQTGLATQYE